MLESVAGSRSAADLDAAGRRRVLDHLRVCGAVFRLGRKQAVERPVAPPETAFLGRRPVAAQWRDGPDVRQEAEKQAGCRGGVLSAGSRAGGKSSRFRTGGALRSLA